MRSNRGRTRRSEPTDNRTVVVDPTVIFRTAHEWLDRIEGALDAARGSTEARREQPAPPATSSNEPQPDPASTAPPTAPPPADLPGDPLEPVVPALAIEFQAPAADRRSDLPATRFGGQPDWLAEPQWPVSRSLGTAMEFVGQVALHPDDLPWLHEPKMAYLFATNDEDDPGGIETWDPFSGENAVIVQPGDRPEWIAGFTAEPTGPSVGTAVPVRLTPRSDPALLDDAQMGELHRRDRERSDRYSAQLDYDKVGGTPNFFQGLEFPDFETRSIGTDPSAAIAVLMVTDADATGLNLGDAGRGVAFLSPDQRQGAYLWFN